MIWIFISQLLRIHRYRLTVGNRIEGICVIIIIIMMMMDTIGNKKTSNFMDIVMMSNLSIYRIRIRSFKVERLHLNLFL